MGKAAIEIPHYFPILLLDRLLLAMPLAGAILREPQLCNLTGNDMSVSTSLDSVVREFSAPPKANMAEYGANHLYDTGKTLIYLITLGIAKLYEYINAESMVYKQNELTNIAIAVKAELDGFKKSYPKSISISSPMRGQFRELVFSETRSGVEIKFADCDGKKVVLKNTNFAQMHKKLREFSEIENMSFDIKNDSEDDPDIELEPEVEFDSDIELKSGIEVKSYLTSTQQLEKKLIGKDYDNNLKHSENIIAAINRKNLPSSYVFVLEYYVFALGKGKEFTLPKNVKVDESCIVTSGTVIFYLGRLTGKGIGTVVIAAGTDAAAVSEDRALAIANARDATATARKNSIAKAIAPGSNAYADGENSVSIAAVEDSKSHATHRDALAIAAAKKSNSYATVIGARAEAAEHGANSHAIVPGSSSSSTKKGAIAHVHRNASGEATVPGAIVKGVGFNSTITGVSGATIIPFD